MLEKNDDPDLEVFAIWFAMFPGDASSTWPSDLLTDPRVEHYWDEERLLGSWYQQDPVYKAGSRPFWDAWLLYSKDSVWKQEPSELLSWGRTIVDTREDLRKQVFAVLEEEEETKP